MAVKLKSHPVWTAVGLVVLGYIALRLIYVFTQQRSSASMSTYPYLSGGSGSYYYGALDPAPTTGTGTGTGTPLPPATGTPAPPPPTGPGPAWQRFGDSGFNSVANSYLDLFPRAFGVPLQGSDGSGMAHASGGPQRYPGGAS